MPTNPSKTPQYEALSLSGIVREILPLVDKEKRTAKPSGLSRQGDSHHDRVQTTGLLTEVILV